MLKGKDLEFASKAACETNIGGIRDFFRMVTFFKQILDTVLLSQIELETPLSYFSLLISGRKCTS